MPFKAKLGMVVMPASAENIEATSAFYSHMFGMEFSRTWTDAVKVYYAPISLDATMFCVEYRHRLDWEERLLAMPLIVVDDLEVAVAELTELGGETKEEPFDMPIAPQGMPEYRETMMKKGLHESQITDKVGVMQRMLDPAGSQILLLQPDQHAQYAFRTGIYSIGMSHEQVTFWDHEMAMTRKLGLGDGPGPEPAEVRAQ
jgi:predicted enzyme related to lactoylglutathione lyase